MTTILDIRSEVQYKITSTIFITETTVWKFGAGDANRCFWRLQHYFVFLWADWIREILLCYWIRCQWRWWNRLESSLCFFKFLFFNRVICLTGINVQFFFSTKFYRYCPTVLPSNFSYTRRTWYDGGQIGRKSCSVWSSSLDDGK